jgi:hypothetical protein
MGGRKTVTSIVLHQPIQSVRDETPGGPGNAESPELYAFFMKWFAGSHGNYMPAGASSGHRHNAKEYSRPPPFAAGARRVVIEMLKSMSRVRWKELCKFLAGAFFVSSGVLFYLYIAGVSVPLIGTNFVHTPEISGMRSIANSVLFLLAFYIGFIRK